MQHPDYPDIEFKPEIAEHDWDQTYDRLQFYYLPGNLAFVGREIAIPSYNSIFIDRFSPSFYPWAENYSTKLFNFLRDFNYSSFTALPSNYNFPDPYYKLSDTYNIFLEKGKYCLSFLVVDNKLFENKILGGATTFPVGKIPKFREINCVHKISIQLIIKETGILDLNKIIKGVSEDNTYPIIIWQPIGNENYQLVDKITQSTFYRVSDPERYGFCANSLVISKLTGNDWTPQNINTNFPFLFYKDIDNYFNLVKNTFKNYFIERVQSNPSVADSFLINPDGRGGINLSNNLQYPLQGYLDKVGYFSNYKLPSNVRVSTLFNKNNANQSLTGLNDFIDRNDLSYTMGTVPNFMKDCCWLSYANNNKWNNNTNSVNLTTINNPFPYLPTEVKLKDYGLERLTRFGLELSVDAYNFPQCTNNCLPTLYEWGTTFLIDYPEAQKLLDDSYQAYLPILDILAGRESFNLQFLRNDIPFRGYGGISIMNGANNSQYWSFRPPPSGEVLSHIPFGQSIFHSQAFANRNALEVKTWRGTYFHLTRAVTPITNNIATKISNPLMSIPHADSREEQLVERGFVDYGIFDVVESDITYTIEDLRLDFNETERDFPINLESECTLWTEQEWNTLTNKYKQEFLTEILNQKDKEDLMPDSIRIKEIHAMLGAEEYAYYDNNGTPEPRVTNAGWYLERIARALGISYKPDGEIMSVRQRRTIPYDEGTSTIPEGWGRGQFSVNKGGGQNGQIGGQADEDRLGIVYQNRCNRYENFDDNDPENNVIERGDLVLCENIPQFIESYLEDLDKGLNWQEMGTGVLPNADGTGFCTYEGMGTLLAEVAYMLSQLSGNIYESHSLNLMTFSTVLEILKGLGVPTGVGYLKMDVGVDDAIGEAPPAQLLVPKIAEDAPNITTQLMNLLNNLALILGTMNEPEDEEENNNEPN